MTSSYLGDSWAIPWINTPVALDAVDKRGLDPHTQKLARSYIEDGFVVLENAISDEMVDHLVSEVQAEFAKGHEGRERNETRLQDAWDECPASRELAADERILDLLRALYGREPIPFQTLNFRYGSEQRGHQDRMFFNSLPGDFMCGVWVALEDVSEDNGALFYYPGSHRLPFHSYDELGLGFSNPTTGKQVDEDLARDDYESLLESLAESAGMQRQILNAKKGTVLIWAAGLIHGGSPIRKVGSTRWSQVTHYFFEDCLYYTPIYSNEHVGDLYLRAVCDVRTGEPVLNSYCGLPVEGVDENAVYKIVLDSEGGRDVARAVSPLAVASTNAELIRTLESNVRDYKSIVRDLENSLSFRVGKAVTAPLRMARNLFR